MNKDIIGKVGHVLKPDFLNISLGIVYFSLEFLFLSPALNAVTIIPCRIFELGWSWCSVNPMGMTESTAYFGAAVFDYVYQVLYLIILVVLPYVLAAYTTFYYRRLIQRWGMKR